MNRYKKILKIRKDLRSNKVSIGSWIQIPNSEVAEIMGDSGYEWMAIDMEHGSISLNQLPNIFRALELGNTLPLVRVTNNDVDLANKVLDAGSGGVIFPKIETSEQLKELRNNISLPTKGERGIGFSRANLYGKNFETYVSQFQNPFLVGMIESEKGVKNLSSILEVKGLDAIFIGPYDLSASLGEIGNFQSQLFKENINQIIKICKLKKVPIGIHIVYPDKVLLNRTIKQGFQFIAYSIDSLFLRKNSLNPIQK